MIVRTHISIGYLVVNASAAYRSMDRIIPEKHRTTHWGGYGRVMKSGVTKYGRSMLAVPALTMDGRRISIVFSVM